MRKNLLIGLAGLLTLSFVLYGCGSSSSGDTTPPDFSAKPTGPRPAAAAGGGGPAAQPKPVDTSAKPG